MSASTVSKPESLLPDEQPLAGYRSVAPLAVVAVVLGVASALILTTPLLAPLPVAAMVAAIGALRSISSSDGQLAGRAPAIFGLCLGTFFLGLGLTSHLSRQRVLELRAREMADVFVGLLEEGKSREAHQFRQIPAARITAPEALAEYYTKNPEAAKELQGFVTQAGVKDLIALGREADARFEAVTSATHDAQNDMLVLKYSYARSSGQAGERQPLWIHVNRKFDETSKRPQWDISGITNTPPTGITE